MTETLCDSGAVKLKAGANVNSTILANATGITQFINQAESTISTITLKDWVAIYSTLTTETKKILEEVSSNLAAQYMIMYDMSGFTSRFEAETMLDVLNNGINRGLSVLRDDNQKTFLGAP